MRTIALPLLFSVLLVTLAGCPAPAPTPPRDAAPTPDTTVPPTDMGPMDAFVVPTGTPTPIASVVNAAAADHPASMTNVIVTGSLVALTTRLFISQSTTSHHCLFAIWVGTAAGGDYSGIEVTDSFLPATGMDCFTTPAHVIPAMVNIGDTVTTLSGQFQNFCPAMSTCPANTSQELSVTNGSFVVGAAGATPMATTVTIDQINGTGTTLGARDMALQGALVTIVNTVVQVDPLHSNHDVMMVSTAAAPSVRMPINVSKYMGVSAQRAFLCTATSGSTVGSITGVLQYSFGQWVIQPRQASDLPGIMSSTDAGVCPDA